MPSTYDKLLQSANEQSANELSRYIDVKRTIKKRLTNVFISKHRLIQLNMLLSKINVQISRRKYLLPEIPLNKIESKILEYKLQLNSSGKTNLSLAMIQWYKRQIKFLEVKASDA